MADALSPSVSAQAVAGLKRENAQLSRSLSEVYRENQTLKRQLFHITAALDVAVGKLNSLGISLEPPFDVRSLRGDVKALSHWAPEAAGPADVLIDSQTRGGGSGRSGVVVVGSTLSAQQRRFRLQTEMKEHQRSIECASFCPDDQQPLIATGGQDRKVHVSNFMTGAKVLSLTDTHEQNVSDVGWLSGSTLLTASFDATVKVTDISANAKATLFHGVARGFVLGCCIVTDHAGLVAAVDTKKFLHLFDTRSGRLTSQMECSKRANTIVWDASSRHLISGHSGGVVHLWDIRKLRGPAALSEALGGTTPPDATSGTSSSTVDDAAAFLPKSPNRGETLESTPTTTSSHGRADVGTGVAPFATPPVANSMITPAGEFINEPSKSSVLHVGLSNNPSSGDERRLFVVSDDNMARIYGRRTSFHEQQDNSSPLFDVESVISGLKTRSYTVRAAMWRFPREKRSASMFDDGERDADRSRDLLESDIFISGGGENFASVFDVTDSRQIALLQRLDGHRARVVGSAIHHSASKPIVATFSEDATTRIWIPSK